jgi:HSP20 family protein
MFVLTRPAYAHRTALAPSLNAAFDRLFDDTFDRAFSRPANVRTPAMDVSESDSAYTVTFDVPGVTREQLKVTVDGRKVTVATEAVAETPAPAEKAAEEGASAPAATTAVAPRALYRERSVTRYSRTVSLPAEVDQAQSDAKFENGVLTLTLAKKVPTGARQISIR